MSRLPIKYMELESIYARTFGAGIRSLAVTSSVSGEGVTTVAEALGEGVTTVAEALAERVNAGGKRALLVELNMFHPELSRRLSLPRGDWQPDCGDYSRDLVVQHNGYGILSAPTSECAPMRFREQQLMRAAIESWLQDFDAVILDTSPLNAVNQGNIPAEVVCGACDGGVLVVLAGRTSESAVRDAAGLLRNSGGKLLGAVFNDQYNPTLASEMLREAARLSKSFPRIRNFLSEKIRQSVFLNASV
jgi:Mrp family chromosome partitioning ATPase